MGFTCASCRGSTSVTDTRPLNLNEASRLSEVLYRNHVIGRARFELYSVTEQNGSQVFMSGEVDWAEALGIAEIRVDSEGSSLAAVAWFGDFVAEHRPSLDGFLRVRGVQSPSFVVRRADSYRRLDTIIKIIASLATTTPENQLLIRQAPGSAYLREDILRGVSVDVMRYGETSVYWISKADGSLMRFEGNDRSGKLPIVVDLLPSSSGTIALPPMTQLIQLERVPEIESALTGF